MVEPSEKKEEIPKQERAPYSDRGVVDPKIEDNLVRKMPVANYSYGGRVRIAALYANFDEFVDKVITVCGWARTVRLGNTGVLFVELSDGSTIQTLQVSFLN